MADSSQKKWTQCAASRHGFEDSGEPLGTKFIVNRTTREGRPSPWGIDYRSPWDLLPNGKRRRVKQFFATKAEREREALRLEDRFAEWGAKGNSEIPAALVDDYQAARRMLPDGVTMAAAAAFYVQNHVQTSPTVPEAFRAYVDAKTRAGVSLRWVQAMDSILVRMAASFPEGTRIADVTAGQIQAFIDSFDYGAETKSAWRRIAFGAFKFAAAEGRGWIKANPVAILTPPKIHRAAPHFLTVAQWKAVLESAVKLDPDFVLFFILGGFAGIRSAEICRMEPGDIRADRFVIDLPGFRRVPGLPPVRVTKSGKRRVLERIMDEKKQDRGAGLPPVIWKWIKAFPKLDTSNFLERRRAIVKAAGVWPWPKNAIRHTFTTYHVALNQSADRTGLILGHEESSSVLWNHYRGFSTQADARRFFSIDPKEFLKG